MRHTHASLQSSIQTQLRQRGAAVVAALLIVALAVSLVAGLLWQQHVQIRALENIRSASQIQWSLRLAVDFLRLLSTTDLDKSNSNSTKIWSVPLAETNLSDFLGQSGQTKSSTNLEGIPDTLLSGRAVDAQGRFNLTNLVLDAGGGKASTNGQYFVASAIDPSGLAAYSRLLVSLGLPPSLAPATAQYMLNALESPDKNSATPQGKPLEDVPDLLLIPGYTAAMIDKLRDFVVVLPQRTTLNVNTASPENLAAAIVNPKMNVQIAQQILAQRPFNDVGDFQNKANSYINLSAADTAGIDVTTNYILVYGLIRQGLAERMQVALVERSGSVGNKLPTTQTITRILWVRPIDTLPLNGS